MPTDARRQLSSFTADGEMINRSPLTGIKAAFACLLRADGIRPYGADVRLSSVGEDIILPIPFSGKSEKIYAAYHLYGIVL